MKCIFLSTVLACCLGGLPRAALAQKAVGAVTRTRLTSEAASRTTGTSRAMASEAMASRHQTVVTSRTPTFTDDSTAGYAIGSTWLADDLYTLQVATARAAGWLRTPNHLLPGDQIGLHLDTVTLAAAGTGYAAGDTVAVTGGAVLTVATITGAAATGPIGTVTLTSPAYHACANTAAGGLAQVASNGGGTGATFTGTFLGPYLYGARLLTVCYRANKAVDVAGLVVPRTTIGFAASGLIDYATIDSLFPTGRLSAVTLYDQGIAGANGTNPYAYSCTISPLRTIRGLRPLVCDGDTDGVGDSGVTAGNGVTAVTLPAGLSVKNNSNTLIFVGGIASTDHKTGFVNVGQGGNPSSGIYNKLDTNLPNVGIANGSVGNGTSCSGQMHDRDNVILAVQSTSATICILNGVTGAAGAPGAGATVTGGYLSATYDASGFAFNDYDMAAIVPWPMSAAEAAAADASIQTTFGIQRQARSVIVIDADSATEPHGSPAQHGWARMLMEQLDRPDIQMVDVAHYGEPMGGAAIATPSGDTAGSRLADQPLNVLPALDAAHAADAPNIWAFMGLMDNNGFTRGDSVATVEGYYRRYCAAVHAHHGRCALMYATTGSANMTELGSWIADNAPATGPGADLVMPYLACPSGTITCSQSDGVHPSPAADFYVAQSALRALAPVLK